MDPASPPPSEDPITTLLATYTELNSSTVTTLYEEPSALEFMRYVALNRPFVVRGGASNWEAMKTWNVTRLKEIMGDAEVNVAVTSQGNADSPTLTQNGLLFLKPHEESQPFSTFLTTLISQSATSSPSPPEILYAQTQNDNLRSEYLPLYTCVPPTIPWARIALSNPPEAINLWIGNSHSVTALHKDNYENIYVQVLGQKHFVLLPPVAYPIVEERELSPARYVREKDGTLGIVEEEGDMVPFATWDPDRGHGEGNKYEGLIEPMRVTLEKGDMLYLPALWYHKVSQSCDEEGICCAVNYWHDMEFGGSFYSLCNLVRNLVLQAET